MSKNKFNWNPYPQEEPDKEGFYLATISDNDNYVEIRKYSKKYKFGRTDIIAWMELPKPYDKIRTRNAKTKWHPYNEEKPYEFGYYLSTVEYQKKISISISYWFNDTREFFNEDDKQVLAWAELPEPYKRDK